MTRLASHRRLALSIVALVTATLAAPTTEARPRKSAAARAARLQRQASPHKAWERPVGHRSEQRLSQRARRKLGFPAIQEVVLPASAIKGPVTWDNIPLPKGCVAHSVKERDGVAGREVVVGKIATKDIPLRASDVLASLSAFERRFAAQPKAGRPTLTRVSADGARYPVYKIELPALRGGKQKGRAGKTRGKRPVNVLVSSWVHGDEPVGPATALKLVDLALRKPNMRRDFDLTVLVKVDPIAKRKTPEGIDPNRSFADGKWIPATKALAKAAGGKKYDLFVDLHADVEPGFFLISEADRAGVSPRALSSMKTQHLLDATRKNTWVGDYDFKHLGGAETKGLSYCFDTLMAKRGTPYSYTMEAPRTLAPEQQVRGMLKLLRSTMYNVARHGKLDR